MAAKLILFSFWIITLCRFEVFGYNRFEGPYCLRVHARKMEARGSSEAQVTTYETARHHNTKKT